MRIRSIHPNFWRSEDVSTMPWDVRLVFIGLWSYVDDNGVGRDVERYIVADLFAGEDDPRDTLATVSRALAHLSDHGQITRYTVAGKPYLHITAWSTWQKIDKPARSRYPLPTCDNAHPRDSLATVSRQSRDSLAPGEGEKGRRGEGEKKNTPSADADAFDAFWADCPRKVGKDAARRAWKAAIRRAGCPGVIHDGLRAHLPAWATYEPQYIPHPSTWLNEGRWQDDPPEPRTSPGQARTNHNLALVAQFAAEEAEQEWRAIGQ